MSRIDLKGFGRPQDDDYDECFFGDSPTDIENDVVEHNIDANNDETFGVVVGESFDDLEKFSKQTESFHLDDDIPRWFGDMPTCSLSVPEASEVPLPPSSFGADKKTTSIKAHSFGDVGNYATDFAANNGGEYSLFTSTLSDSQRSDAISNRNLALNGSAFEHSKGVEVTTAGKGGLIAMPKDAITLEELERKQFAAVPKFLSVTSSSVRAISAGNLERRYMLECTRSVPPLVPTQRSTFPSSEPRVRVASPFPPRGSAPVKSANTPYPFFPAPPPPPAFISPVVQLARAYLLGQIRELPPGFPPLNAELRAASLNMMPPNASPLGLPPRFPFSPPRPTGPICIMPPQYQRLRYHQLHSQSKAHHREQQRRQQNLPSNKTLSDFALSPYAGFMSQKEKDWLVKIQLLQSAATGNTHEDDFYYSAWKEKTFASKFSKEGMKGNSDEVMTNTRNAYVPPKFVGSLGRPTSSTAKYPRQLIDLSGGAPDDEDKTSVKGTASQKKLRALLMELENVLTIVIDCEDKRRALSDGPADDVVKNELTHAIESGVSTILSYFTKDNRLEKVLLIHKGRQIFVRTLAVAEESCQLQLIQAFFVALNYAAKRVTSVEMNTSLLAGIYSTLMHFSKDTVMVLIRSNKFTPLPEASSNSFIVNLLVTFLLCCCRNDCHLDGCFCSTTLQMLFRPKNSAVLPTCNIKEYVNIAEENDFSKLESWFSRNITGYRNSLVEKLINTLRDC